MPNRVRLQRKKGWRMPENAVKVDRTTKWGNPLIIGKHGTREECIAKYRRMMMSTSSAGLTADQRVYRDRVMKSVYELQGRDLACWCKPGTPCHADVLLELANR
ncbi:MAG: DUF4326 domain-containing protein [Flavobacteriales bacterium]|nr:DUF4326 domain-containing protein [Flavobacteriales bacterium]MCB9168414.1 DUF4326 domain-containing protein [Flavobacteriales bacterium]